ncbi:hypothetical protein BH23CYA1_BH23CYA1_17780 [soil metagenome]
MPLSQTILARMLARFRAYLGLTTPGTEPINTAPSPDNHPPSPCAPLPALSNADLQREIRAERKFSLAEAISREGGGFMKGESTIPRPLRATTEIKQFITTHLEPAGAISTTLQTWASSDIRLSRQLDTPLVALSEIIASILAEPTTLSEFARQVAIAHSQLTGDRPQFHRPGQPPDPTAAHTHLSIRAALLSLHQQIPSDL